VKLLEAKLAVVTLVLVRREQECVSYVAGP